MNYSMYDVMIIITTSIVMLIITIINCLISFKPLNEKLPTMIVHFKDNVFEGL